MSGPTPGSWRWDGDDLESDHVMGPNYGVVIERDVACGMHCAGGAAILRISDEDRVLIAAAPTMLDALLEAEAALDTAVRILSEVSDYRDWPDSSPRKGLAVVREAIAKAHGKPGDKDVSDRETEDQAPQILEGGTRVASGGRSDTPGDPGGGLVTTMTTIERHAPDDLAAALDRMRDRLVNRGYAHDAELIGIASEMIRQLGTHLTDLPRLKDTEDCYRRLLQAVRDGAASGSSCESLLVDLETTEWVGEVAP